MFMIFSTIQFMEFIIMDFKNEKKYVKLLNNITNNTIFIDFTNCIYIYVINEINHPFLNIFILIFIIHIFYNINGYSTPLCSNNYSSPVWGNYKINMLEIVILLR